MISSLAWITFVPDRKLAFAFFVVALLFAIMVCLAVCVDVRIFYLWKI